MPAPFKQLTRDQFADLLSQFHFTRKINAVHMHHTWRPNRSMYRGHDTIVSMWRYHTQTNGWSDIAQHISIAPDGTIWLGRNWNMPPASASGHNGNRDAGPFMFEMIGDFDRGSDPFDGEQHRTAIEVIARVQMRFGLPPGTLQLHNMMSSKSCPGSSIDYHAVVQEVTELHQQLVAPRAVPATDAELTAEQMAHQRVIREAAEDLARGAGLPLDPADAEPCLHDERHRGMSGDGVVRDGSRDAFTPAEIQALKPHVVNMRMGAFSSDGDWTTEPHDVDAIFDEALPAALEEARREGRKLRLMMYAHGGLNKELAALRSAQRHLDWWRANGFYPIFFIWETGLGEILGQMLEQSKQRAPRGFISALTDPLIEEFVHHAGGVQIWSAMKESARRASAPNILGGSGPVEPAKQGAAYYLAQKLGEFYKKHAKEVEVHAAGHSAGAIFQAHFIPCALAAGVAVFKSLHLLAPAIRTDLFKQQLAPLTGKGIDALTMYTMQDTYEKADSCAAIYRKSLLYLIFKGLEPERDAPILGLQRCLRADPDLRRLFGLGTERGAVEAIWSVTAEQQGRSASRATKHGDFDDDPATLGSIIRRALGKEDADRIVDYQERGERDGALWMPAPLPEWMEALVAVPPAMPAVKFQPEPDTLAAPAWQPAYAGTGRKQALCVGIDTYPTAPLGGCVNDAKAWRTALGSLGFETALLLDAAASRAGIVDALTRLVSGSRAGDVLVFQYSGHGTQVPDLDGDEAGQDTPGEDEAMCPHDFANGELLIDDDLRRIFSRLPRGVNLTCFFDCCHSGTITRMALGASGATPAAGKRARFVQASPQLVSRYAMRRSQMERVASTAPATTARDEAVFSACLSSEVALEVAGQGEFTRHALKVLEGLGGMPTNAEFADRVTAAFGPDPAQHAKLYATGEVAQRTFLAVRGAAPGMQQVHHTHAKKGLESWTG